MTESNAGVSRRGFMRVAAGAATASAATGSAVAAEEGGGGGGGEPDFGGHLDGANNHDGSVTDARGQSEVTVEVGAGGGLAFGPAAIHVDTGATVVWEWTGEGGSHNVVNTDGAFESELVGEAGHTFSHTFEEDGVYNYYCNPHRGAGMLGSVVVGTDYPTAGGGGGATPLDVQHMGSNIQEHYVGVSVILAVSVALVFTFFLLKYGESANTKGGNN